MSAETFIYTIDKTHDGVIKFISFGFFYKIHFAAILPVCF